MRNSEYNNKYDASLEFNVLMYDKLPYIKDNNICGPDKIQLFSGNVIKYYSFFQDEPVCIKNQDEKTQAYIWQKEKEIMKEINQEHDDYIADAIKEGLSDNTPEENVPENE